MKYDVIIIGSGAGSSAAAYQLTQLGRSVLLLEKGMILPKDGTTLDVTRVAQNKQFIDNDPWLDRHGQIVVPEERSNLGGKTKWYGAALLRFSPQEFEEDEAHQCLPWPISYNDLAPYYDEAERLMGVIIFPIEPDLQKIVTGLRRHDPQWKNQPLPVALSAEILNFPNEAKHFDAFASARGLKGDGEKLLNIVKDKSNLVILIGKKVVALKQDEKNNLRVCGVECEDGSSYEADIILLAGGTLHSPQLLQGYLEKTGLASKLPCYNQIGRNYKFHMLTAMLMLNAHPQTDILRKTTILLHDALPHSSVQPLGWMDGELLAPQLPTIVPRWLANIIGKRVYGFFLQTEDGSHADNRVIAALTSTGLPRLDYDAARLPAAAAEHKQLVSMLRKQLLTIGYIGLTKPVPLTGTAHACGTLVMGNSPVTSAVDANGRVHGLDNVYVVDGSVLPRSSRVNPALTIYAWALRVASLINKLDSW